MKTSSMCLRQSAYPIAQVVNEEADDAEKAAAADFVKFVAGDEAKAIFEAYYFDTNVE